MCILVYLPENCCIFLKIKMFFVLQVLDGTSVVDKCSIWVDHQFTRVRVNCVNNMLVENESGIRKHCLINPKRVISHRDNNRGREAA